MSDSEDYDQEDHELHAGVISDRSCTDIPCCIIFLLYCAGMVAIGIYAFENGDLRKAHHLYDYQGQLCGVDANVSDKPYAYYCLPKPTGLTVPPLSLETPVCVAACPATFNIVDDITYCPEKGPVYNSTLYASKVCMPALPGLKEQMVTAMTSHGGFEELLNMVDSIERGWPILLATAVVTFVAGFGFLVFLRICARPIVYCTILTVLVGSIGFGAYLIFRSQTVDGIVEAAVEEANATASPAVPDVNATNATLAGANELMGGNRDIQQTVGYFLVGFGVLFTCVVFVCCRKSIEVAIAVIEESTNVIFAEKVMLLEPCIELLVKGLGTVLLAYGMLYLFTCGTLVKEELTIGTTTVSGMKRSFEFTDEQTYMLGYWLLGLFWYQELVAAIGLFCLAYGTVAWYYTLKDEDGDKEVSGMPLCKGLQYAFQYHLGSLAFGSFIIAACRFIQFVLSMMAKQAKEEGNAVFEAIAKCLICVIECFKRTVEFLNKNAYINMAIHSTSFCHSAWDAFAKILINAGAYSILNGAAEIIKWLGIFLIALVGTVFSWGLTKISTFTDQTSPMFLESPYAVIAVSGLIAVVIAVSFMMVFDMVADSLLYCFVDTAKKGSAEAYCPDSLLELMTDEHDRSCC